jgi:hypothetical protein
MRKTIKVFYRNKNRYLKIGKTPLELLSDCKSELFKSQVEKKLKSFKPVTVLKNRDKTKAKNIFYAISIGDLNSVKKLATKENMHTMSSRGHTPLYLGNAIRYP